MSLSIYTVDAFAERPFTGNPAAVCLLSEARDDAWMQSVAAEMNLAETAFLLRRDDGFSLRWFTPTLEVDLCGHATLASAHVLWETGALSSGESARFYTRSGLLTCTLRDGGIEMDFPAEPPQPMESAPELEKALGVRCEWVGRNRMDYLARLSSEAAVRNLTPDMQALARLGGRGAIVTANTDGGPYDFISRFFAPAAGVPEDPVTGSAHCALAPFWADWLNRLELTGYQASKRGGVVRMKLQGERVLLTGHAITVLKGELVV